MSYGGHPVIPNLTAITPTITLSRASGPVPFVVQVHASDTTATFGDGGAAFLAAVGRAFDPFCDLEFSWSFGDPAGTETLTHPVYGTTVNANADQRGPEAAYVYRTPGTYTITLTVRGWDGTQYRTASTTATVTVAAWSGSDRYFDSAYDGSGGASDGTLSRPYTAFADLKAWIEGGSDRRALLRRGSSWSTTAGLAFETGSGLRVEAYGAGAAPVLEATAGSGPVAGFTQYNLPDLEDVVFAGVELRAGPGAQGSLWLFQADNNGSPGDPYNAMRDWAFLDCTFAGPAGAQLDGATGGPGAAGSRWTFWRGTFFRDGTTRGNGQGLLVALADGLAVVGGSFAGGDGSITFDHHVYPTIHDHAVLRWVDFQAATSLNFCVNTNARKDGTDTPRFVVDGCDLTGTQNGTDASNANNNPAQGRFDQFVVQHCAYHVGQIGTQALGVYSTCLRRFVVRDCGFWGHNEDIRLQDAATHLSLYRTRFDGAEGSAVNDMTGGAAGVFLAGNTYGVTGYPPAPDTDATPRPCWRGRLRRTV